MNEEQISLANAYVDDELSDDERLLAEADPVVMAEVDALHTLRGRLRDIETPSPATREAAIRAALAEFRADADAPEPVTEQTVVPYRPRPAYGRVLAIAAAVVGIGVLGVVIVNSDTADDDSAGEPALVTTAVAAQDQPADDGAGDVAAGAGSPADAEQEFAEEELADFEAADEAASEEPAEEPAEMSADEAASADATAAAPATVETAGRDDDRLFSSLSDLNDVPGRWADLPITNEEELAQYGTAVITLTENRLLPPSPESSCDAQVLGRGWVAVDEPAREVLIAVDPLDPDQRTVWALDPETCEFVLTATRTPIP